LSLAVLDLVGVLGLAVLDRHHRRQACSNHSPDRRLRPSHRGHLVAHVRCSLVASSALPISGKPGAEPRGFALPGARPTRRAATADRAISATPS
jgi:hypothetical protein